MHLVLLIRKKNPFILIQQSLRGVLVEFFPKSSSSKKDFPKREFQQGVGNLGIGEKPRILEDFLGLLIPINFTTPGWWIETFPAVLLFKRTRIYLSIRLKKLHEKNPSSTKYRRRIKEEDQGKEKPGYLIS